ncbi:MAG: site-specific DNA-methyltransferase [Oscillospiraceae bacterium]|nr:site-specific DNA-methyltransferase [Oscillospiraceae bacterium]
MLNIDKAETDKYKEVNIENIFSDTELSRASQILHKAGTEYFVEDGFIRFRFDEVDIKILEEKKDNPVIDIFLGKLRGIRSFSISNGKLVYASFNKDKKVKDKSGNRKKRLAYEYYKKDFPETSNLLDGNIINNIYCADSLVFLKSLPDNCIDAVLTSPPYNFGINYNNTSDVNLWDVYFDVLFNIFRECIRVLKSGGRIIVNLQPMFSDYIPTHHIVSKFFIDEGLIWKGEIIWEKNNYNCKYCTWGSWKSPAAPYLKYSWEFIEVFCKNSLKKEGLKDNIDITADEFKQFVYAKWSMAPERNMKRYGHDAMFPEALAERCLKLFSYKEDIILDPFNGAGTTTKVAKELGRKFIGIDIDENYCETAKDRLRSII